MKREKMSQQSSEALFKKTGATMNSKNQPKISRGGIRF